MKIEILPLTLLRLPLFSYTETLEKAWPRLKEAIGYSSESFYPIIKNLDYSDIENLSPKAQFTIWKYFNRAKYRATPYGHFASCSTLQISNQQTDMAIRFQSQLRLHEYINWPCKNEVNFDPDTYFSGNRIYIANETVYYTLESIRYIFRNEKEFEIAAIDRLETIEQILNYCNTPRAYTELETHITAQTGFTGEAVKELLADLLEYQLLYTDLSPNIIGQDYFERIRYQDSGTAAKYLLAEREITGGAFPYQLTMHFNACLNCLLSLSEPGQINALQHFRNQFLKRFEQGEIPLIRALDPELGVGYDGLEQYQQQQVVQHLFASKSIVSKTTTSWGRLEQFLLESVIAGKDNPGYIIRLDKLALPDQELQVKPGNTFSALISMADDLLVAESIGGCTANALLGRFTRSNTIVEDLCKQIVSIEEQSNPGVIFFDIAYLSEDQIDNVNRRQSIYNYELPILVYSCSITPITVQDIYVSVAGEEIILRSRKYNKRLIPRLTSAYNYSRSDLSLYRFLCDLQHQGIQSQLTFDITRKIPGLKYYPRLQYRNIVLSLAKWKIDLKDYKELRDMPDTETEILYGKRLLLQAGVSRCFKAGAGDQTLSFDQNSETDMIAFFQYVFLQKANFYVEEVVLPQKSQVYDEHHKPYLPQFLLSMYHTGKVYPDYRIQRTDDRQADKIARNILPGNDWLYFEIYCHPKGMDALLLNKIKPFACAYREHIISWFFIRYQSPQHHIRFRLQLGPGADTYAVMQAFSSSLAAAIEDGQVSDLELKTYHRETARYGADLIEDIERHFCTDSIMALKALQYGFEILQSYAFVIRNMRLVMEGLHLSLNEQLIWAQASQHAFSKEHQWNHLEFKKLNQHYSLYWKEVAEFKLSSELEQSCLEFGNSFVSILSRADLEREKQLFSDLFHMHINRLFSSDQRVHEGIIYYFLVKELQRALALNKL